MRVSLGPPCALRRQCGLAMLPDLCLRQRLVMILYVLGYTSACAASGCRLDPASISDRADFAFRVLARRQRGFAWRILRACRATSPILGLINLFPLWAGSM